MKKNRSPTKFCEKGATMIEYALVVGLIALATFMTMSMVGNKTYTALREATSNLDDAGATLHTP